jgi:hypothetical protein
MVQLEQNTTLTLKNLASSGVVISAEQQVGRRTAQPAASASPRPTAARSCVQAALDYSIPIKRIEAGLKTLVLWGRLTTLNGKVRANKASQERGTSCRPASASELAILEDIDASCTSTNMLTLACHLQDYLVAEGFNLATASGSRATYESKFYFSQDGAKWADLPPVAAETAVRAARVKGQLSGGAQLPGGPFQRFLALRLSSDVWSASPHTRRVPALVVACPPGDPAKNFELEEKDPAAPPPAEGEEDKGTVVQVPELAVLRTRVDAIGADTSVVPTVRHLGL